MRGRALIRHCVPSPRLSYGLITAPNKTCMLSSPERSDPPTRPHPSSVERRSRGKWLQTAPQEPQELVLLINFRSPPPRLLPTLTNPLAPTLYSPVKMTNTRYRPHDRPTGTAYRYVMHYYRVVLRASGSQFPVDAHNHTSSASVLWGSSTSNVKSGLWRVTLQDLTRPRGYMLTSCSHFPVSHRTPRHLLAEI